MTAILIDGKASAAKLREKIAAEAARLKAAHGLVPGLATVLAWRTRALYQLLLEKYYIDEIYDALITRPRPSAAERVKRFTPCASQTSLPAAPRGRS